MAINAHNRTLPDWFTRVRTRQTVLPRFQRFEAWSHDNVTQMLNTVLRGLPLGSMLVLEVGNEELFVSRPISGAPETGERVTEHLLDGQQRLTGLWRALTDNYDERTYVLKLGKNGAEDEILSLGRWTKAGETARRPFWIDKPQELWERGLIPLSMCRPDAQEAFAVWKKEAIADSDERERVTDRVATIRQTLASYNLPFLSLPVTTSKDTALDVFIKMNTSAAALKIYDIVVAQIEAQAGTSLHERVAEIRDAVPAIDAYYDPEQLALNASALLQGKQATNGAFMTKEFGPAMLERWSDLLVGVKKTVAFLEAERVFDSQRLPSDPVIPVLVALWADAPDGLDAEGKARHVLRRYFWRAAFTNRYEITTAFRAFGDYTELRKLIAGDGDAAPGVFNETDHPLPEPSELIPAGWPKNRDRLARGILAVCLKHSGLDLADGSPVTRENLAQREYHHLYPDAHLKRLGVEDRSAWRSLNCALVTWRTNRNISDKDPERYLQERLNATDLGESELRARLESHLIPYDAMIAGDYSEFLSARAELVHAAMVKACSGSATV